MTYDLHIHPLNHKYYHQSGIDYASVVLDDDDKTNIRAVVDWCCNVRRLDVIGITDHDMIQASLYAREYAQENKLPIKIVTGAECELIDPKAPPGSMPMHLLCLGLERLPSYTSRTSIQQMYDHVRALGGVILMSHPGYYPESYYRYRKFFVGYEYENGAAGRFEDELSSPYVRHPYLYHCSNSDFHYSGKLPQSALFTSVENSNDIFVARKSPTAFMDRLHPSREEQFFAIKRLRDNKLLLWLIEHMDDTDVVHVAIDAYTDQEVMYELLKSGRYFKSDYEAHIAGRITSPCLTNRLIHMPLGDSAIEVLIQVATNQKAIDDIFETSDNGSILVTALQYISNDMLYRICMLDGKCNCFCGDKAEEFERLSCSKEAPWRNHETFDLRLVELRDIYIYIRKITDQQALLDITLHSPHPKIRNEAMYMLSPDTLKQLVLKTKKLNLQLYAIRELEQIDLLTEIATSCVNPKVAEEAEKRRRVVLVQTLVSNTTPESELYELVMKHFEIETQERAILFMKDRENLRKLIVDHLSPEIRKAANDRLKYLIHRGGAFIDSSDLD